METRGILKIIFKILSLLVLAVAFLSLGILFIQTIRFFYYGIGNIWRPLLNLSFAGLGIIGFYGLWKFEKWIIVIFGINFINVLIAQWFKLTELGSCCSTTPNRAAAAILLSGGVLSLVYLSRKHLYGPYIKWLPIVLFVALIILNQISLSYLLDIKLSFPVSGDI